MERDYKCAYKYCKEGGRVSQEESIKGNNGYYHFGCFEKKEIKNKIFQLFCKYVTNDQNGTLIKMMISRYIDKEGLSANYLYFVMCYCVVNKLNIHTIFGLRKIADNKRILDQYNALLVKNANFHIQPDNIDYVYKKELKKGWSDLFE